MATGTVSSRDEKTAVQQRQAELFSGRRGRIIRNNITAYLFLAPAAILIFTFGIFPIFYAIYVSLYRWRIRQDEYRGFANYVEAMGDVAYVFFAILIIAMVVIGVRTALQIRRESAEADITTQYTLLGFIPSGFLLAGIILILLRFITFFTQQRAIDAGEAQILGSIPLGIVAILIGIGLNNLIERQKHQTIAKTEHAILPTFIGPSMVFLMTILGTVSVSWFVLNHLLSTDTLNITLLKLQPLVIGLILIVVAYFIWTWAMKQYSNYRLILGVIAASLFIGAAIYVYSFWDIISRGADPDFYLSFTVTIFYAIGAVPLQLGISLVLAYLLYQDVWGRAFFRIVFFIPYIAPTVAGAAIFQVLFSARTESVANRFVQSVTFNQNLELRWLREAGSFIGIIGESFGLTGAADWSFGPSLALIVVILFSIWRFVGYDTVIFLAGLGGIPGVLYEAAEIDGANRFQVFRHVTLPLLSPTTFFLSVISILGTFKAFNTIWVLRDNAALGTTDTASIYFFETFQRGARFGYAASMAMVLFVVMLTLTIIQNRLAEERVFYG